METPRTTKETIRSAFFSRSGWLFMIPCLILQASCTPRMTQDQGAGAGDPSRTEGSPYGMDTEEDLLKKLEHPKFERLDLRRNLNKALLRPPSGPYRVGPGDVLSIEIAENKNSHAKTKVMPDGMLYYDVATGLNVKGKTIKEISRELSVKLEKDYVKPVVSVNVEKADSQRFRVLGQVHNPGAYALTRPTNLIQAISMAGGLYSVASQGIEVSNPESADLERAILIRKGNLIPADFQALIENGDLSQNVYIQPGDYIYLPSTQKRSIYVMGQVQRPGPVVYDSGASVLSTIAAAGGTLPNSISTKILIIRGNTRTPQVAVVNIRRIMKGFDPDLALEGGDIIWVPRTAWTKLAQYVDAVLNTAGQTIAVQEGLGTLGTIGGTTISINTTAPSF